MFLRYKFYSFIFNAIKNLAQSVPDNNNKNKVNHMNHQNQPTAAYIFASWAVGAVGLIGYLLGLFNAEMALNEKGYYIAVLLLSLYSAISLQKSIRDREEGIPVTNLYMGITWATFGAGIALLVIGLFNAELLLSEKGYYGMSFVLSLFAVITIQKNVRDLTDENGITDASAYPKSTLPLEDTVDSILED